jgi:phage terminase small subunit
MPQLSDPKRERFAQLIAKGVQQIQAYHEAGFRDVSQPGNAAFKLRNKPDVAERVDEILAAGAKLAGVEVSRVLEEISALAFADIRQVVQWSDEQIEVYEANPDELDDEQLSKLERMVRDGKAERTPEGMYLTKVIVPAGVRLLPSNEITDRAAASIAEVSQTAHGLRVKMHSKPQALEMLGKYLQMWSEGSAVSQTSFAVASQPKTADEWMEAFGAPNQTEH